MINAKSVDFCLPYRSNVFPARENDHIPRVTCTICGSFSSNGFSHVAGRTLLARERATTATTTTLIPRMSAATTVARTRKRIIETITESHARRGLDRKRKIGTTKNKFPCTLPKCLYFIDDTERLANGNIIYVRYSSLQ